MNGNISNEELIQFLENEELQSILRKYHEASEMAESAGFNVFTIISDYYYRENFHGDILMAFLDPKGKHGEGDKFLKIFIEMLGVKTEVHSIMMLGVKKENYGPDTTIEREVSLTGENKGRMDFVIKNNDSANRHCIIIENKINYAPDMPRQLPRYYEEMKGHGYSVDSIVYLVKYPEQIPETLTWKFGDLESIRDLISVIPINNLKDRISLIRDWTDRCIGVAENANCKFALTQYSQLLAELAPNYNKISVMNSLLDFFKKEVNVKYFMDAMSLNKMMCELPSAMAGNLRLKVGNLLSIKKFGMKIGKWEENSCVIHLDNQDNCIWVYCYASIEGAYRLGIRGKWHDGDTLNYNVKWCKGEGMAVSVDGNGAYLSKDFGFGEEAEEKLLEFICNLIDMYKQSLIGG